MKQHSTYSGYVKLPRDLFLQPIWQDTGAAFLLIYCLMRMTTRPYGELMPGQFVASKAQMAKDMYWSRTTLSLHLSTLESQGLLHVVATNQGTLITVLGWEDLLQGHLPPNFCASAASNARSNFSPDPSRMTASTCPDSDRSPVQNLMPNNNSNKKKTRINNIKPSALALPPRPDEDQYRHIWRMYPAHRRCTQSEAYAALDQALAKGATLGAIEQALTAAMQSADWNMNGGRFVRSLVNWLATEPWHGADKTEEVHEKVGSASWRY